MRFVQIGVAVELHEEVHELQANFFGAIRDVRNVS
jgi:hypothetical protein